MRTGFIGVITLSIILSGADASLSQTTAADTTVSISQSKSDSSQNSSDLKKFRKFFKKVVESEKAQKKDSVKQDPQLNLGGFVLDETRSKMGRDFYALFYQKWQAPEDAGNFSLTISEKPTIGRGSQITIKIDYEKVYSARLQPRYEYIDALSQQAVNRCQNIIKQQTSVKQQLMGY